MDQNAWIEGKGNLVRITHVKGSECDKLCLHVPQEC